MVLTAYAQKYFGRGVSFKRVLAISSRALFFLSTTPFCWGVLGAEKLCSIPCSSQNNSKSLFSKSLINHEDFDDIKKN